jgi:hypothetical protein
MWMLASPYRRIEVESLMASNKGELPETFPSKLLEDFDQLEQRYGPKALHTLIQHRRRTIKGHPRKRSQALVKGVWHVVETVKFFIEAENTKRVCELLARHAIIDEMTETCAFASGTREFLESRRKPAGTWRRLYVEGQRLLSDDEQRGWRERLSTMPVDPAFVTKLHRWYSALPKKSAAGAALGEGMILPRPNHF